MFFSSRLEPFDTEEVSAGMYHPSVRSARRESGQRVRLFWLGWRSAAGLGSGQVTVNESERSD